MTTTSKTGLKVKTTIKAGGFTMNHSVRGLKVRSAIKAGGTGLVANHSRSALG